MNFNYPDFLNQQDLDKFQLPPNSNKSFESQNVAGGGNANSNIHNPNGNTNSEAGHNSKFNDILFNKLSTLEQNQGTVDKSPHTLDGIDPIANPQKSPMAAATEGKLGVNNVQLPLTSPLVNPFSPQMQPFSNDLFHNRLDTFNLPSELQGGVGTINSRRPSYAAESFTRSMDPFANFQYHSPQSAQGPGQQHQHQNMNLAQFATMNNYSINQLSDGFSNFNLNSNFNDFQSRRPSQLVDFDMHPNLNHLNGSYNTGLYPVARPGAVGGRGSVSGGPGAIPGSGPGSNAGPGPVPGPGPIQQQNIANVQASSQPPAGAKPPGFKEAKESDSNCVKLENGLALKDQYIVASPELKGLFNKTVKYFQDPELTSSILESLKSLLVDKKILKLITFIKNLNNLTFNHKILCLVINKNGKFDLLSYPNNSNIHLQKNDLVIVDGDRGKDLVMILEPFIDLNFAILFNFLKKIEHLKSLNIVDDSNVNSKKFGGTHSTDLNASYIVNNHSNEDNEFIITLPTKQVLRFATPREIHKISGKFLEEKKAFITCYNKIKELKLENNLQLINVEYQSDFKKLIFYYYANFQRIDFRGLIKELFKIYKTRIWLCAVLPYDNAGSLTKPKNLPPLKNSIPNEYNLSNDQIVNFSIDELHNINKPNYFHSVNLKNLIDLVNDQLQGNFYGFS